MPGERSMNLDSAAAIYAWDLLHHPGKTIRLKFASKRKAKEFGERVGFYLRLELGEKAWSKIQPVVAQQREPQVTEEMATQLFVCGDKRGVRIEERNAERRVLQAFTLTVEQAGRFSVDMKNAAKVAAEAINASEEERASGIRYYSEGARDGRDALTATRAEPK